MNCRFFGLILFFFSFLVSAWGQSEPNNLPPKLATVNSALPQPHSAAHPLAWVQTTSYRSQISPIYTAKQPDPTTHSATSLMPAAYVAPAAKNPLATNRQVNNPVANETLTQNQTSTARAGNNIVVSFNRSDFFAVGIGNSTDGGQTWQEIPAATLPGGTNLGDSLVTTDVAGNFYLVTTALNPQNFSTITVARSPNGHSWSELTDAVTTEVRPRSLHDRPWLAIDRHNSPFRNQIYVAWVKFDDLKQRSTVMLSRATTTNFRFSRPIDITPQNRGFTLVGARVTVGAMGEVYLTWFNNQLQQLFFTRSLDGGQTFTTPQAIIDFAGQQFPLLLNGSFAINPFANIVVDSTSNNIYLVYNAPPVHPQATPRDKSDVWLQRSTNAGQTWSEPIRINDDTTFTDQWQPSATVTASGKVAVTWYDRRNDPINNGLVDVYLAVSIDGGQQFQPNYRVTTANWPVVPTPPSLPFGAHGEYNQISSDGEQLNIAWADDRNGSNSDIFFSQLTTRDLQTNPADDFILSARTLLQQALPGQTATFLLDTRNIGNLLDPITLTATSNLSNITPIFTPATILAGNGATLKVFVPMATPPGHYVLSIVGNTATQQRTTLARLTVPPTRFDFPIPQIITQTAGNTTHPQSIVDATGNTHLVFQDDTNGRSQIFYRNKLGTINVSQSVDAATQPQISCDSSNTIHIVWQETRGQQRFIVYTRSVDGGQTFTAKRPISPPQLVITAAQLAAGPENSVNLVWAGQSDLQTKGVFFSRSLDQGESFSPPVTVQLSDQETFFDPTLTIDSLNNIHIAYVVMTVTMRQFNVPQFATTLLYVQSRNQGESFTEPQNIFANTPRFSFAESPQLVAGQDADQLFLVFSGFSQQLLFPSREIFVAQSFDNGSSFRLINETVSKGNGDSVAPTAVLSADGVLNIVWQDTQTGNFDIFFSRFFPQEQLLTPAINIALTSGISQAPTLTINQQQLIIAWQDDTSGNNEIVTTTLSIAANPIKINRVSSLQAAIGEKILVEGENFANISDVRVGRFSAQFQLLSTTKIEIALLPGSTAGTVLIITPLGFARSREVIQTRDRVGTLQPRLSFGAIALNSQLLLPLRLINNSSTARQVQRISSNNSLFTVMTALPLLIPPQANIDIMVQFQPRSLGLHAGLISISSNDQSLAPLFIELLGVGLDAEAPQVQVITPLPGQIHLLSTSSTALNIQWQIQDNTAIAHQEVRLSLDGGQSFPILLASGLENQRQLNIKLPIVNNLRRQAAQIQVIAVDLAGNRGEGRSGVFEIRQRRNKRN
jgi:hypothetical protein